MKVSALSSGSSGNCFYLESNNSAILVDAGISAKRILERIDLLKRSSLAIQGIFITHEHIDHLRGADVLARQLGIPIFATRGTIEKSFVCSNKSLIKIIKNNARLSLKDFEIEAFSKSHSAAEPVSFSISSRMSKKRVSIITDAGFCCDNIARHISKADFLFLESNHDLKMLESGSYPYYLKSWIKSDKGHLSNNQAAIAVLEHAPPSLSNIVLSHLSEVNNTPKKALTAFRTLMKERKDINPELSISGKESPTQLFSV